MQDPADNWAARVDSAAGRWDGQETEVSVEQWRAAMTQRAGQFGTPEWHASVRRATRRAWLRHPLRMIYASFWWRVAKRQRGRG